MRRLNSVLETVSYVNQHYEGMMSNFSFQSVKTIRPFHQVSDDTVSNKIENDKMFGKQILISQS